MSGGRELRRGDRITFREGIMHVRRPTLGERFDDFVHDRIVGPVWRLVCALLTALWPRP
jgi:hypothetical protein